MKKMSVIMLAALFAAFALVPTLWAQTTSNQMVGVVDIDYQSRVNLDASGNPVLGTKDTYKLALDAGDLVRFEGLIEHLPTILGGTFGQEKQAGLLSYDIQSFVRNPANLAQVKPVGKFIGAVPIDRNGVYRYNDGTLRISIKSAGTASQFESRFRGLATGKPPKNDSALARVKKEAQTITRQVQGKAVKIVVTDYDKMAFNGLVLAAGPAAKSYPETTVNGEMLYDYERDVWFFRNLTMSYEVDGKPMVDKISGNISWVESPNRATSGEGEYQFDVRLNEKEVTETEAAFFSADDESAFFTEDPTIAALVGSAKYKDVMGSDETVTSSKVTIALTGNNLNRTQMVNLAKLFWFVSVVPMNAE